MTNLRDQLDLLETAPSDPDNLSAWRVRIDAVDRIILHLLNHRSNCANEIGRIKKTLDMPVYVPRREEEVLRNVMEHNPGPLPDTAVRRLFERIIDETRSLERHRYQDNPDEGAQEGT
ncbi:MAG: chorismate mutase [Bacteroidetes bacterium CG12_big_fil_rev_8_21_14_0_65_60_17]|nr:MAG: chorismate mutase [Bacteroidetes bacterium CG12_big_fil_rev_8_21_14_0_65_60_17]